MGFSSLSTNMNRPDNPDGVRNRLRQLLHTAERAQNHLDGALGGIYGTPPSTGNAAPISQLGSTVDDLLNELGRKLDMLTNTAENLEGRL